MNNHPFSAAYIKHFKRGPFPGQVDPWAEDAHYFHQIHGNMIGAIMWQISDPLLEMGYIASQEASIAIAAGRKPDISVQQPVPTAQLRFNYTQAATAALAEPGLAVEIEEPELQAIHIKRAGESTLVTVVEIISPRNKTHPLDVLKYQEDRAKLFLERGVNVVEIDPTRSVRRLLDHELTRDYAYHTAVFIPGQAVYIIVSALGETLKRCALPLRETVVAVDLQAAYDQAYQQVMSAPQIENDTQYSEDALPYPSLLENSQKAQLMDQVQRWHDELARLRQ